MGYAAPRVGVKVKLAPPTSPFPTPSEINTCGTPVTVHSKKSIDLGNSPIIPIYKIFQGGCRGPSTIRLGYASPPWNRTAVGVALRSYAFNCQPQTVNFFQSTCSPASSNILARLHLSSGILTAAASPFTLHLSSLRLWSQTASL